MVLGTLAKGVSTLTLALVTTCATASNLRALTSARKLTRLRPLSMSAQPSPSMSPVEVTERQLEALQQGDVQTCFNFASPANRKATGPWQRFELMVRQTPAYQPLVGSTRFAVVGALPTGDNGYRCRVRVWPAGGSSAPFAVPTPVIDYDWLLTLQGEDAGVLSGCWSEPNSDGLEPRCNLSW